jgi:uncharacterized membrane protein
MFIIAWLSMANTWDGDYDALENQSMTAHQQKFADASGFDEVHDIILGRCSMCHAREPVFEGIRWAPKGVYLETANEIAGAAKEIYIQAGVTHAMPPANITELPEEDRVKIVKWYRAANGTQVSRAGQ